MSLKTQQAVSVGNSTPVLLVDCGESGCSFTLIVKGANDLVIGDSTVTATTGVRVAAGGTFFDVLETKGEDVYGICAAGQTTTVDVWQRGV